MPIIISIATVFSTLFGGLFALKFRDKLHLILGYSAGAVIGVAFFDLMPEAIDLGSKMYDISIMTSIVAAGFIGYMILDRFIILHTHVHEDAEHTEHAHGASPRGLLGAGSLSIHSFLDGVAIGLAFKVSIAVGAVVAVAVLAHDFSDGINTVNLVLKNKGERRQAFKWLVIDALAPAVGVISTFFFSLPESGLGIVLAVFAGFFLYIGASDLLPESHHGHPKIWTSIMTVLGIATMFIVIRIANL